MAVMTANDDDLRCVLELERELQSLPTRGDPGRLRQLLSPTFMEIGASGRCWDLGTILDLLVEETAGPNAAEIGMLNMEGRRLGAEMIQVFWVSDRSGRRARRMSLWQRSHDRWEQIYHQATVLP